MYERISATSGRRGRSILKLITAAVIVCLGFILYGNIFKDDAVAPAIPPVTVVIPAEAGASRIATLLVEAEVIDMPRLFQVYVRLRGYQSKLRSGTYVFDRGTSIRRVVNWLVAGTQVSEIQITLVEGWTASQYAQALAQKLATTANSQNWQTEFMQQIQRPYQYEWLASKPQGVDLEGYLFPDTYRFNNTATPDQVITVLLNTFGQRVTADMQAEIVRQGKTLHQIITLASIIEREVQTPADRRLVADLFWRRLEIGMPLQADSTVNYVTGKKDPAISATDKAVDSPYNTYRYPGLPPGPISNPGLDTIIATINPEPNDAWYFLTTPEGEVIYSRTLAEQAAAKAKYLP